MQREVGNWHDGYRTEIYYVKGSKQAQLKVNKPARPQPKIQLTYTQAFHGQQPVQHDQRGIPLYPGASLQPSYQGQAPFITLPNGHQLYYIYIP